MVLHHRLFLAALYYSALTINLILLETARVVGLVVLIPVVAGKHQALHRSLMLHTLAISLLRLSLATLLMMTMLV